MLKKVDHPNIIKIYEFFQNKENFFIVTELCTGGELYDKIILEEKFDERQASIYMN